MDMNKDEAINEGRLTRAIEKQTAKVPSIGYLGLALTSMAASATIALVLGKRPLGNFVGLWAPSFLLIGIYNKVVKLESDLQGRTLH